MQRALLDVSADVPVYSRLDRSKAGTDSDVDIDTAKIGTVASSLDLTHHDCIDLLVAIKDHPCLYDPLDPSYRTNKQYKEKLWNKICADTKMTETGVELEKKWNLLQKEYREWRQSSTEPIAVFTSMKWLDKFLIPLPERASSLAICRIMQLKIADREERKQKRRRVILSESADTLPESSSADVFEVSTEELQLSITSMTVTPPPAKIKKATPRRIYATPSTPLVGLRRSGRLSSTNTLSSM